MIPLKYNISAWDQLSCCLSNLSRDLHIHVTEFVQNDKISGTRIRVEHETFGVLFACVINAQGSLVSTDSGIVHEFTSDEILAELKKYGFDVTYNPVSMLSGDQIEYLMTLNKLNYDKLRILPVRQLTKDGQVLVVKNVVAFNTSTTNPKWLDAGYVASNDEFISALMSGDAFNVSAISESKNFNWTWLDNFVASIDDVIRDYVHSVETREG